jgi:cation diffusion facilitator family transporter
MQSDIAKQEKLGAAMMSVLSAIVLTGLKILVGVLSGSLGILAEAAHSGLDLLAALVTYFAVSVACRPADRDHPYGHGKVENLSALVETLLLLGTCAWIVYEAVKRLLVKEVAVDASIWTFLVMVLSIAVDVHRSRRLYAAARKYRSQALEADALHFSTDIWSSAVVILGLSCVQLAAHFPSLESLHNADAVAALLVAVIVVFVSLRLGFRTIDGLLDVAPAGMADQIKHAVEGIPGVIDCHQIRARHSGPHLFIDIHVHMDGGQTLKQAHELSDRIEERLQQSLPEADVTVHPEPALESEPRGTNFP